MDEHLEHGDCCLLRITDPEGKVYIGSTVQPVDRYLKGIINTVRSGHSTDENSIGHAIIARGFDNFSVEMILIASESECRRLKPIYVENEGTLDPGGYNIWPYRNGASQEHCTLISNNEKSKALRKTEAYQAGRAELMRRAQETRSKRAGYPMRTVLSILEKYPDRHTTVAELRRITGFSRNSIKSAIYGIRQRKALLVSILPEGYRLCATQEIFEEVEARRQKSINLKVRLLDALSKTPEGLTCSEIATAIGITRAQARNICYPAQELEKMPKEKAGVAETRFRLRKED